MRPLAQFVLVVIACSLVAAAADAQTINACVMKNGLLKVVDDESDCRPQEDAITLNEPQPEVETARVFDGEGRDVGAYVDAFVPFISRRPVGSLWRVLLPDLGVIGILDPLSGSLNYSIRIHFSEPDCEGRGYVSAFWSNTLFPDPRDGSWLIGSTIEFPPLTTIGRSTLHTDGSCQNSAPVFLPAADVFFEEFNQELGLTFPLPFPLWIGSSSASQR